ncbi:N-acetylneuraminate synthase family protein [Neolewinella lacunae]|uniref:N-acetylneuraminate synthase family protein n=1 Tax=Neolewinella lacunae TaxID=1517758 RepID=A0A923TCV5_9BACT|nr:N-acetylneuraminate synthase family protein [Neolewinella lacunae]MBC6994152.1 N-acetylneuraminate synthase family protein [Neolewinella lacunae]MDN3636699.1 N-acetylneuraminate synthase family protein [Neolewinella lacunae]
MTKQRPVYLIAEVAQAHDGSLGILHSYIDALAATGVDAVKFQTHVAAAESSAHEPFRVRFSYADATRYDYWERMGFTLPQWQGIKDHCTEAGVEFLSSCFSQAAVDMMEAIGMARYKVGSGEVTNFLLLEKIARTGKPILLSSGLSNYAELDAAVDFLRPFGNDLSILQCTTAYPTPPERVGLNVLAELRARYPGVRVGLSEHTALVATGIAAVALGAEVLEFHAVFDRRMFGPDAPSSLTIDEISRLVAGVRQVETMLANPVDKSDNSAYGELKGIFEKSLAVGRDLPAGHVLTFDDLEAKKPAGYGLAAADFRAVLGRKLRHPLSRYAFLTAADLEP